MKHEKLYALRFLLDVSTSKQTSKSMYLKYTGFGEKPELTTSSKLAYQGHFVYVQEKSEQLPGQIKPLFSVVEVEE
ncbi:hypothetical protein [Eupransor demetentiae]|uniref:Uncharacterized protein n=1 Tax=Eupransor demetentiae TaxID=3109584 RepID=A0ABM9N4P0_9LACO|nr:hypothetical protein R54876_GBNLAHCA_00700 [Lactobacillaceae bacterium LMG 33000]